MTETLRVALAQINVTVGDLDGNRAKILSYLDRARAQQADVVVFPELAVPGYPPEDLLLKPTFIEANRRFLQAIAEHVHDITAVIGFVDRDEEDIYNAAAVLHAGQIVAIYRKMFLPNYGVFDEYRYFGAGIEPLNLRLNNAVVGVNICEDIWNPAGPMEAQALEGAQIIVNLSSSPYYVGKIRSRQRMLATRAADSVAIVCYCNLVGGQDELVFDGASLIFDQEGELVARGKQFEEDLVVADLDLNAVFRQRLHDPRRRQNLAGWHLDPSTGAVLSLLKGSGPRMPPVREVSLDVQLHQEWPAITPPRSELLGDLEEIYAALVLGTRDYMHKNGFRQAVIGLSGGIDSSMTAVIAAEALGPENVTGVSMPSRYTSDASLEDARTLAQNLGIRFMEIPIDDTFQAYLDMLAEPFGDTERGVTEENIQARIRGNILMALSNKFGWLVLTTGNKSEMSVGYATLYGDMAGGFAVIKDVPKMVVYELARLRNAQEQVIPQRVLERPPTAELRPNQTDQDTLPPYEVLDPILHAYVVEDRSFHEIVARGFDVETVSKVIRMVDRNEYKRRQAPPGVKITERAFGRDRRLPITNQYSVISEQ
ncbi:MAG: NAD+ synthase [Anaerolineae bacterium]